MTPAFSTHARTNASPEASLVIRLGSLQPRVFMVASDAWTEARLRRRLAELEPFLSRWRAGTERDER